MPWYFLSTPGLSSCCILNKQLPSPMDHFLNSTVLGGFFCATKAKKLYHIFQSCLQPGCDLHSNHVLELGLESELRYLGREREVPIPRGSLCQESGFLKPQKQLYGLEKQRCDSEGWNLSWRLGLDDFSCSLSNYFINHLISGNKSYCVIYLVSVI